MSEMCPCGLPLHYLDQQARRIVERMVDLLGPTVNITVGLTSWAVPRHYIALHGLRAIDLPELAARFGFVQVSPAPHHKES